MEIDNLRIQKNNFFDINSYGFHYENLLSFQLTIKTILPNLLKELYPDIDDNIEITYGEPIYQPTLHHDSILLTPIQASKTNTTYGIPIYYNNKQIYLGNLPIPVLTPQFCPISLISNDLKANYLLYKNEDIGGYFIWKGQPRIIQPILSPLNNTIFIHENSSITYIHNTSSIHLFNHPMNGYMVTLRQYNNKTIPLFIVFRSLGLSSDFEIILYCVGRSYLSYCLEDFRTSIYISGNVRTIEDAELYIKSNELFPNIKCLYQKTYMLAYIVKQSILHKHHCIRESNSNDLQFYYVRSIGDRFTTLLTKYFIKYYKKKKNQQIPFFNSNYFANKFYNLTIPLNTINLFSRQKSCMQCIFQPLFKENKFQFHSSYFGYFDIFSQNNLIPSCTLYLSPILSSKTIFKILNYLQQEFQWISCELLPDINNGISIFWNGIYIGQTYINTNEIINKLQQIRYVDRIQKQIIPMFLSISFDFRQKILHFRLHPGLLFRPIYNIKTKITIYVDSFELNNLCLINKNINSIDIYDELPYPITHSLLSLQIPFSTYRPFSNYIFQSLEQSCFPIHCPDSLNPPTHTIQEQLYRHQPIINSIHLPNQLLPSFGSQCIAIILDIGQSSSIILNKASIQRGLFIHSTKLVLSGYPSTSKNNINEDTNSIKIKSNTELLKNIIYHSNENNIHAYLDCQSEDYIDEKCKPIRSMQLLLDCIIPKYSPPRVTTRGGLPKLDVDWKNECDMPYSINGDVVDIIIHPKCLENDLYLPTLYELLYSKMCLDLGYIGDYTPYIQFNIDKEYQEEQKENTIWIYNGKYLSCNVTYGSMYFIPISDISYFLSSNENKILPEQVVRFGSSSLSSNLCYENENELSMKIPISDKSGLICINEFINSSFNKCTQSFRYIEIPKSMHTWLYKLRILGIQPRIILEPECSDAIQLSFTDQIWKLQGNNIQQFTNQHNILSFMETLQNNILINSSSSISKSNFFQEWNDHIHPIFQSSIIHSNNNNNNNIIHFQPSFSNNLSMIPIQQDTIDNVEELDEILLQKEQKQQEFENNIEDKKEDKKEDEIEDEKEIKIEKLPLSFDSTNSITIN